MRTRDISLTGSTTPVYYLGAMSYMCIRCGRIVRNSAVRDQPADRMCGTCRHHRTDTRTRDELWMDDAPCTSVGTDAFFPEPAPGRPRRHYKAPKVCADCPVRDQCLQFALNNDFTDGIYGGLTPAQREHLHRAHRAGRKGKRSQ